MSMSQWCDRMIPVWLVIGFFVWIAVSAMVDSDLAKGTSAIALTAIVVIYLMSTGFFDLSEDEEPFEKTFGFNSTETCVEEYINIGYDNTSALMLCQNMKQNLPAGEQT